MTHEPRRLQAPTSIGPSSLYTAIEPSATGGAYINFLSAEGEERVKAAYGAEKFARLQALEGSLRPDQPVPPEPERDAVERMTAPAVEQVQILVYDGVDELDVVAPYEVLSAAGLWVELVSIDPTPVIRAAHGLSLIPARPLGPAPELLVVPGGGWLSKAPHGAWTEVLNGVMPAAIAERHAAGSVVAAACTGAMLLAAAGLLEGRPAVTHRAALDDLREAGAEVHPDARVVDDGDVLTAGGVSASIDLGLHLVRRVRGHRAALAGADRIEHRPQGPVVEVLAS